jgi:hypothetical protein
MDNPGPRGYGPRRYGLGADRSVGIRVPAGSQIKFFKSLNYPAKTVFAGFFVFWHCQETPNFFKFWWQIRAGKNKFKPSRPNSTETLIQQGVQKLNMSFQRDYEW